MGVFCRGGDGGLRVLMVEVTNQNVGIFDNSTVHFFALIIIHIPDIPSAVINCKL